MLAENSQSIEQIDDVWFFPVYDDDPLAFCKLRLIEEGGQTVLGGRPGLPRLLLVSCCLSLLLLRLLFLPVRPARHVNLRDEICQMDLERLPPPYTKKHLERLPFRIAVFAVPGEDVVIGRNALKEIALDVVGAAMMRCLQHIHMNCPAGLQDTRQL